MTSFDSRMISTVPAPAKYFLWALAANFLFLSPLFADEGERKKVEAEIRDYRFKTVTTPEGLNFNVPEDMPIEKRNGVIQPIPFEEYLYFKFSKIQEKLTSLDEKMDKLQVSVDQLAIAQKESVDADVPVS